MSILIKGMEMPDNCRQCSLYLQSMDSERSVYENCAVTAKSYNWGLTTRPSDCPLVPVPKHGRLLKVLKTERECVSRDCNRDCRKCDLSLERDEILNAYDTLIALFADPAEEGE